MTAKSRMGAPIFIVGLHRTGSTVWHNLVAMYPEVCRLTETRFLGAWWQRDFRYFVRKHIGNLSEDANIDKMVEMMLSEQPTPALEGAFWRFENIETVRMPEFKTHITEKIKASDRSIQSIFMTLIEEIALWTGHRRVCVKFPVDVSQIPTLLHWYPKGKIVHITRDPRAIGMSKTNDPSGTAIRVKKYPFLRFFIRKMMLLFTVLQYARAAKVHSRCQGLQNYRLFRYEDLLADPERTVRELSKFLEIEYSREMLSLENGRHEHQPSSLTGRRQKAFDKAAATRWRGVISPSEKWLLTVLTRPSMSKFDYNPETHPIFSDSDSLDVRSCETVL